MLYSEKVMDHFQNPRNVGKMEDADGVGEVGNAKCGDIMRMYIKVNPEDQTISDVKFNTFGCGSALHYFQAARPQQGKRKVGQILQMQRVQFFRFIVIRMERAVDGISGSLGDHCFLKQKMVTHAVL